MPKVTKVSFLWLFFSMHSTTTGKKKRAMFLIYWALSTEMSRFLALLENSRGTSISFILSLYFEGGVSLLLVRRRRRLMTPGHVLCIYSHEIALMKSKLWTPRSKDRPVNPFASSIDRESMSPSCVSTNFVTISCISSVVLLAALLVEEGQAIQGVNVFVLS